MEKVYEFKHNDCIWESSPFTVSIHRTPKGAYKAMRKYIMEAYTQWYDERMLYGKDSAFGTIDKFGTHEWWGIKCTELHE